MQNMYIFLMRKIFHAWFSLLAPLLLALAALEGVYAAGLGTAAREAPPEFQLARSWQGEDGTVYMQLTIELQGGWKTYWFEPGPFGIPPKLDLAEAVNLKEGKILLPEPYMGEDQSGRYVGYSAPMSMVLALMPEGEKKAVSGSLSLFYGICSDICVPAVQGFEVPATGDFSRFDALPSLPKASEFVAQMTWVAEDVFEVETSVAGEMLFAHAPKGGASLSLPEKRTATTYLFKLIEPLKEPLDVEFVLRTGLGGLSQTITLEK